MWAQCANIEVVQSEEIVVSHDGPGALLTAAERGEVARQAKLSQPRASLSGTAEA